MSDTAKNLIAEVLKLEPAERAEIAAEIIASLDGESDPDAEEAWAAEIERRIERIRSGSASGRSWSLVRDSLRRRNE